MCKGNDACVVYNVKWFTLVDVPTTSIKFGAKDCTCEKGKTCKENGSLKKMVHSR